MPEIVWPYNFYLQRNLNDETYLTHGVYTYIIYIQYVEMCDLYVFMSVGRAYKFSRTILRGCEW